MKYNMKTKQKAKSDENELRMLRLGENEMLEAKFYVKATNMSKKFGSGRFYISGERVIFVSDKHGLCLSLRLDRMGHFHYIGRHEFVFDWTEGGIVHHFQAKIKRHGWKRRANTEVYSVIDDIIVGPHGMLGEGWRVDANGVPYNKYMPEFNDKVRQGKMEMWEVNSIRHDRDRKKAKKAKCKTIEEWRWFMKHWIWCANYIDGNYNFVDGLLEKKNIDGSSKISIDGLERCWKAYENRVRLLKKDIEECKRKGGDLEKIRNFGREGTIWLQPRLLSEHGKYNNAPLLFTGTFAEYLARLTRECKVRKRIFEIIKSEYKGYTFNKMLRKRQMELDKLIREKLDRGEDISRYNPPTKIDSSLMNACIIIARAAERLNPPLCEYLPA